MKPITSAVWRVSFQVESLTNQTIYGYDFPINGGRTPASDFAKELLRLGYVNIETKVVLVL